MFEPVDGKFQHVRDPDTDVEMFVKSTSEIESLEVFVRLPNGRRIQFGILHEPKYPDRLYVPGDRSNPTIGLPLASFKKAVDAHPKAYYENSIFVRYLLGGLSTINRRWPLSRSPFFYSDLDFYKGRENLFPFAFPSDEEIAKL
jgi:hypothetical protein